jgi:putative ABC transport system permease protein
MLQLKNIKKSYTTGDFTQVALNNVNVNFRKNEFVAILGQSGSGKTTCLNIIGGLDHYDSGDLIINGKSTSKFKDSDWDAYRNNSIGYIFQSYNLINHLSIIDNVEMGMTLSGVSSGVKHKKALEAIEKVGLKDHIHKKPNQLSGGQMQRVAIARALANDPDIILADEPTGALDSSTSVQIMELIKEIADDKLVVMVTHNPELAEKYVDRIVKFKDGQVIADSNPYDNVKEENEYKLKKTSMSFTTALKLSGKNIASKKWRTGLTAFASSIGIIAIALILSLSSGFQAQIEKTQGNALSEFPITISQEPTMSSNVNQKPEQDYVNTNEVKLYDPLEGSSVHTNVFTDEYLQYIKNIDPELLSSIGYTRTTGMNLLREANGKYFPISSSNKNNSITNSGLAMSSYPETLDNSSVSYLEKNYELLSGKYPKGENDLVLMVDSQNRIDFRALEKLGFDSDKGKSIAFKDIVGTEFKLIDNDEYYVKTDKGTFIPGTDFTKMYSSKNSITLRITGIIRLKKGVSFGVIGNGICYSDKLVQHIIDLNTNSEIVKAQRQADNNVITNEKLDESAKTTFLSYLGGESTPYMISLYPKNFDSKESIKKYLDDYNKGKTEETKVIYSDLASSITQMSSGIMNGITVVLIAFASISLVVTLIMICIITYISVLERTKEIGILRALGARKKDITRVFNAETFIIGALSGILAIGITYLLTIPVNKIIEKMSQLSNVAKLNPAHAIVLIVISVTLTMIGGSIPAKMAAKKDPVEALRTE